MSGEQFENGGALRLVQAKGVEVMESEEGSNMEEQYISGTWNVKAGNEEEFIERWKAFTGWAIDNAAGARSFVLLRDLDEPTHFVSFGTWTDHDSARAWKNTPEFAERMARCRELCESMRGSDYSIAASFGRHPAATSR